MLQLRERARVVRLEGGTIDNREKFPLTKGSDDCTIFHEVNEILNIQCFLQSNDLSSNSTLLGQRS
jgi:hypothetical protein